MRDAGLTLGEISSRLANEGILSTTGRPYGSNTISKVIKRARRKQDGKEIDADS